MYICVQQTARPPTFQIRRELALDVHDVVVVGLRVQRPKEGGPGLLVKHPRQRACCCCGFCWWWWWCDCRRGVEPGAAARRRERAAERKEGMAAAGEEQEQQGQALDGGHGGQQPQRAYVPKRSLI